MNNPAATWATRRAQYGPSGLRAEARARLAAMLRLLRVQGRAGCGTPPRWRCVKGHLNWRLLSNGHRKCRTCERLAQQRRRARQQPAALVLAGLTPRQIGLQRAWAKRRADRPVLPHPRRARPRMVAYDGGRFSVIAHDRFYRRERRRLRATMIAAHPDTGGTSRQFTVARNALDRFLAREARWYAELGLMPPPQRSARLKAAA